MKSCGCGALVEDHVTFHWTGESTSRGVPIGHYVEDDPPLKGPKVAEEGARVPDTRPTGIPDTRLEAAIQRGIKEDLEMMGFHVSDLSQDRPTRQTAGIPDLFVMGNGIWTWMEVKTEKGRTSKDQKTWHAVAAATGVSVVVVRSSAEAVSWAVSSKMDLLEGVTE